MSHPKLKRTEPRAGTRAQETLFRWNGVMILESLRKNTRSEYSKLRTAA